MWLPVFILGVASVLLVSAVVSRVGLVVLTAMWLSGSGSPLPASLISLRPGSNNTDSKCSSLCRLASEDSTSPSGTSLVVDGGIDVMVDALCWSAAGEVSVGEALLADDG